MLTLDLQAFANNVVEDEATVNATWLGLCVVDHHADRKEDRSDNFGGSHLGAQVDPSLGVVVVPCTYGAVGARIG